MSLDSKSRASKHHWVGHRIKRPHFWEVGFVLRDKEMREIELSLSVDMFVSCVEKNLVFKLAPVRNPASRTWKISPQNMPLGMCCLSILACRNSFRVWRPCPGRNPDINKVPNQDWPRLVIWNETRKESSESLSFIGHLLTQRSFEEIMHERFSCLIFVLFFWDRFFSVAQACLISVSSPGWLWTHGNPSALAS